MAIESAQRELRESGMDKHAPVAVRITHRYQAPPERVFDAWLNPEMLARWMFGPDVRDEKILRLSIDARVGGTYSFLVRRGTEEIDHIGTYIEIDRPRRLVFTWGIAGESDEQSTVSIDIISLGPGCELTLIHELDPKWRDYVRSAEEAWEEMLGILAMALDATGSEI